MRVSRFGSCAFFASLTATEALIAFAVFHNDPYVFWFLLMGAVLFFGFVVLYGKYYVVTELGIVHKLMGFSFHVTQWSDIIDIMCIPHQSEKGNGRVLMVTTKTGKIYRPEKQGVNAGLIRQKGFERDWLLRGRLFMLTCSNNNIKEVIACVESYYGPINYNYYEKAENQKI